MRKTTLTHALLALFLWMPASLWAEVKLSRIRIPLPSGWRVDQTAYSDGTWIAGFSKGTDSIHFYAKPNRDFDLNTFAVNNSHVEEETTANNLFGPFRWNVLLTSKAATVFPGSYYLRSFSTQFAGETYYGYSRATTAANATGNMKLFLDEVIVELGSRSLTGPEYGGKKYYLGWGSTGDSGQGEMENEVKYDVLHTHDIFTKDLGGGYLGTKLIGPSQASATGIRSQWNRLKSLITADDMFVQYSSGHGGASGLAVGLRWDEIRDNALAYSAKEIIILTMSCESGKIVDSFNRKKTQWQDFQATGRTLFVMASSRTEESSSAGPGTDPEEQAGVNGSAGSAFGFSLWKALLGYSDGTVDGIKDGFLSLEEIRDFTTKKTQEVGDHTPVSTGVYSEGLIMNRVPPKWLVEELERATQGMTDREIVEKMDELNRAMGI